MPPTPLQVAAHMEGLRASFNALHQALVAAQNGQPSEVCQLACTLSLTIGFNTHTTLGQPGGNNVQQGSPTRCTRGGYQ
jgi:hypothetical protein